jgi:CBS domain-containing protein
MRDFPIDRIMTPDPATVGPLDSIIHARRLLDTNVIHHLPVVEGGRLVGIVSSSDLLKLHLLDDHLSIYERVTVDQVMETNVVVIEKSATLRDAAEKLCMGHFHSLPVVDRRRHLVGIITASDLIAELLRALPASAPVLPGSR